MSTITTQPNGGLNGTGVLLSADTITGDDVCNVQDEKLGKIQDIMLDMAEGTIRYVVLSAGGFLGIGDRLFAVPWQALRSGIGSARAGIS